MRAKVLSTILISASLLVSCTDELPTSPLVDSGKRIPVQILSLTGAKGGPLHSAGTLEVTLACNAEPSLCNGVPMKLKFSEGEELEITTRVTFDDAEGSLGNVTHHFTTPPRARKLTVTLYADREMKHEVASGERPINGPKRGELFFAWDLENKRLVWASRGFERGSCTVLGQWAGVLSERTGSEPVTCQGTYKLSCSMGRTVEMREVYVLSGD